MKNRVAVVTRLHYKLDDPKWPYRLKTYKKYTLPSLLAQTDPDFDIWVWCQPHHAKEIKALSDRIQVMFGDWTPRTRTGKYFINYTPYRVIKHFDKYATQLGIDSDDELMPTAIEQMKPLLTERCAISFQPIKKVIPTGDMYEMRNYEEVERLSPIFAIHQPIDNENFLFVYEYGHYSKMPRQFDVKKYLYGLAIMNIHHSNESTIITSKDIKL